MSRNLALFNLILAACFTTTAPCLTKNQDKSQNYLRWENGEPNQLSKNDGWQSYYHASDSSTAFLITVGYADNQQKMAVYCCDTAYTQAYPSYPLKGSELFVNFENGQVTHLSLNLYTEELQKGKIIKVYPSRSIWKLSDLQKLKDKRYDQGLPPEVQELLLKALEYVSDFPYYQR